MAKVDPTIKRETKNLAIVVLILSALMEAVFLILHRWDYTVLTGNLLGGGIGLLNFFLMGLGLQSALNKDSKDARTTANFSHTMRNMLILVVLAIGVILNCFNTIAVILSLFFTSVGIFLRAFIANKQNKSEITNVEEEKNQ